MSPARIPCRAVFLDAGGVIVLPDRHLVADALARIGVTVDPSIVPLAHYRAVRALDRAAASPTPPARHPPHDRPDPDRLCAGPTAPAWIVPGRAAEALASWEALADRSRSGVVLWREPTPGAIGAIPALQRAGPAVVIVTNSDGHGEENLRDSGFDGVPVIDSTVVGAAKPDPRIFEIALARAGATAAHTVHVGDSLANDVAGARVAGITPIHFDPLRACRATDHRHVRTLAGVSRHVRPCG